MLYGGIRMRTGRAAAGMALPREHFGFARDRPARPDQRAAGRTLREDRAGTAHAALLFAGRPLNDRWPWIRPGTPLYCDVIRKDRPVGVIAHQQRTVSGDRHARRPAPDAVVVHDESRHEIFVFPGRPAHLSYRTRTTLYPVRFGRHSQEPCSATKASPRYSFGRRCHHRMPTLSQLKNEAGSVRLERVPALSDRGAFLAVGDLIVANIVPGPAVEFVVLDARHVVRRQISPMWSRSFTTHHRVSVPGCIARPEQLRRPVA